VAQEEGRQPMILPHVVLPLPVFSFLFGCVAGHCIVRLIFWLAPLKRL
jgi:hypothetical protein